MAVLALGAGGCGNSVDEPEPAKPPPAAEQTPSRQAFAAATTKICARADRRMGAFIPLGTDPTTRHNSRLGIISVLRDQIAEMRALGYPPGSRQTLESVYRAIIETLDRLAADDALDIEDTLDETFSEFGETLHEYTPGCN